MFLTHSLFNTLSKQIDRRVREFGVPSLVAGVWEKGEVIWSHGSGYSDIEKERPADTKTPYSMASITKPATGTVLAILNERGLLDLNRPANGYLGSPLLTAYEGAAEAATLARLANHTAGLPVHYQFFSEMDVIQPLPYAETLKRYGNIVNPPGERQVYSNLGYGALGWIAELVALKPLKELMEQEVLGPLAMQNSFFAPTSEELAHCAVRYEAGRVPIEHYVTDHPGASELYASLDDLLRFGAWHLSENVDKVLSPAGKRRMQNPLDSSTAAQTYGLGWRLGSSSHGEKLISHSGGMAGVTTRLILCPERQLVMAVISNTNTDLVDEVVRGIDGLLRFNLPGPTQSHSPAIYPPDALYGTWKGHVHTYEGDYDLELGFKEETEGAVFCGEPVVTAFKYGDDSVYGTLEAEINTSDAKRTEHCVVINLQMRGDRLSGVATADSLGQVTLSNAFSYPTRLERISG